MPSLYFENCRAGTCGGGRAESLIFDPNNDDPDNIVDIYIKAKIEKLANLDEITDDATQSRLSLYYTPTERSIGSRCMSSIDPLTGIYINHIETTRPPLLYDDYLDSMPSTSRDNGTTLLRTTQSTGNLNEIGNNNSDSVCKIDIVKNDSLQQLPIITQHRQNGDNDLQQNGGVVQHETAL